jgi:hypothetical protein
MRAVGSGKGCARSAPCMRRLSCQARYVQEDCRVKQQQENCTFFFFNINIAIVIIVVIICTSFTFFFIIVTASLQQREEW